MKKTALLLITVFGSGVLVPYAAAQDDVLKKMRAFKAVMDKMPESTREEDEPEVPAPVVKEIREAAPEPVEKEPLPWERDVPAADMTVETESSEESLEDEGDRWTPYKGYTPQTSDMSAGEETGEAEDESDLPPFLSDLDDEIDAEERQDVLDDGPDSMEEIAETMAEDVEEAAEDAAETVSEVIETSEDMLEEVVEEDMEIMDEETVVSDVQDETDVVDEFADEAAETDMMDIEEVPAVATPDKAETGAEETEVSAPALDEAEYEWQEDAVEMPMNEEAKQAAEDIQGILKTKMAPEVLEKAVREADQAAEETAANVAASTEEEPEMNIAQEMPVAGKESDRSAARPRLSLDQAVPAVADEPEILKYRQDLSRELTPDMIDRHAQIDKIKSEIDAEIDEIHADIELITGIKREVADTLAEE